MFVRVMLVPNEFEGNLVCALLRAEGIDCFARETGLWAVRTRSWSSTTRISSGRAEVVAARD